MKTLRFPIRIFCNESQFLYEEGKDISKLNYITEEGFQTLKTEAVSLWKEKRPGVVKALAAAAAEGDRSENAEYIYRKKQLREIDRRFRFLSKRLEELEVVLEKPRADGKVYFGCYVMLEDEEGKNIRYRIVGPDEWDIDRNAISIDSPMAKALLGKSEDDEVRVRLPRGDTHLTILEITIDP